METIVAQSYTVEWKRMAFFRFVELFPQNIITQRLKAKILQYIIIPCFANCFEKGEGDRLIGSPPAPNFDSSDNVVSEFINKVSIVRFLFISDIFVSFCHQRTDLRLIEGLLLLPDH